MCIAQTDSCAILIICWLVWLVWLIVLQVLWLKALPCTDLRICKQGAGLTRDCAPLCDPPTHTSASMKAIFSYSSRFLHTDMEYQRSLCETGAAGIVKSPECNEDASYSVMLPHSCSGIHTGAPKFHNPLMHHALSTYFWKDSMLCDQAAGPTSDQ